MEIYCIICKGVIHEVARDAVMLIPCGKLPGVRPRRGYLNHLAITPVCGHPSCRRIAHLVIKRREQVNDEF